MIGRTHRFHGYNSLRRVYKDGHTIRGSQVNLRVGPRPGKPYRVAVVVSRKVSKSAVVRNQIRRRIYEIVRLSEAVPTESDLVFTVFHAQIAELEASQLTTTIRQMLEKASTGS